MHRLLVKSKIMNLAQLFFFLKKKWEPKIYSLTNLY